MWGVLAPFFRLELVDKSVIFRLGRESGPLELGQFSDQRIQIVFGPFPEALRIQEIGVGDDCRPPLPNSAMIS